VTLHTEVESSAPAAEVRAMIAEAGELCPVCQAIAGRVELDLTADVRPV
jgi:organic hydroperoxide reductase OsmC/OhrA